jgi:hypothetical protein
MNQANHTDFYPFSRILKPIVLSNREFSPITGFICSTHALYIPYPHSHSSPFSRPLPSLPHHPVSDLGGTVRLWDLRSGRRVLDMQRHIKQVNAIDFHANGCAVEIT